MIPIQISENSFGDVLPVFLFYFLKEKNLFNNSFFNIFL